MDDIRLKEDWVLSINLMDQDKSVSHPRIFPNIYKYSPSLLSLFALPPAARSPRRRRHRLVSSRHGTVSLLPPAHRSRKYFLKLSGERFFIKFTQRFLFSFCKYTFNYSSWSYGKRFPDKTSVIYLDRQSEPFMCLLFLHDKSHFITVWFLHFPWVPQGLLDLVLTCGVIFRREGETQGSD